MHVAACRATRVEGRQSDTLLDARMRCLDDWLTGYDGVIADLQGATTPRAVEGAIKGISGLTLDRCADTAALEREFPPPRDPAVRAEADAMLADIKALQALRHGPQPPDLIPRADALLARARKLDYPPVLARALALRWRLSFLRQDITGALALMRELVPVAARAHDDHELGMVLSKMVSLEGSYQGHFDVAKALMPAARAASARAGDPLDVMTMVLNDESNAYGANGETAAALADLAEARKLLVAAGADQPGSPLVPELAKITHALGNTLQWADRLDEAIASFREALSLDERAYGPDTVESAALQLALAQALRDSGDLHGAEAAGRESVRLRQAQSGDSPTLALALSGLADILSREGRTDEALAMATRAVALARAMMPADDTTRAVLIALLGDAQDRAGHRAEALALYDEVLATADRAKIVDANVVEWAMNRGDLRRRLGRCAEAIDDFHRAADLAKRTNGEHNYRIGSALRSEGFCLHELGRDAEAAAALERATAYPVPEHLKEEAERAHALWSELRR
jgi:tetratricopeptide (TPR) repeat protein